MNAISNSAVHRVMVSQSWDLVLTTEKHNSGRSYGGKSQVDFYVERAVVSTFSPFFKSLVDGGFAESHQDRVVLQKFEVQALEIIIRVLHNQPDDRGLYSQAPVRGTGVYELIFAIDYTDLDMMHFERWFAAWYGSQPRDRHGDMVKLLYPCFVFKHAIGFQHCTRRLVYSSRCAIFAHPPFGFGRFRLPAAVLRMYPLFS